METISLYARRSLRAVEPARVAVAVLALVRLWLMRARTRRDLRLLADNPHALADLGIAREQADLETLKPFWR